MVNPPLDARPDPQQVRETFDRIIQYAQEWEIVQHAELTRVLRQELEALLASSAPEPTKEQDFDAMTRAVFVEIDAAMAGQMSKFLGAGGGVTFGPIKRGLKRAFEAGRAAPLPSEGVTAPSTDAKEE